jgi:hypothetical protein
MRFIVHYRGLASEALRVLIAQANSHLEQILHIETILSEHVEQVVVTRLHCLQNLIVLEEYGRVLIDHELKLTDQVLKVVRACQF